MREVDMSNGTVVSVRGLMIGEINDLARQGLPITRWGIDFDPRADPAAADELFNTLLPLAIDGEVNADELTPMDEQRIFMALIRETYGSRDEEKNWLRSGNGSQTESESSTADHAAI